MIPAPSLFLIPTIFNYHISGDIMNERLNNFDFLRITAALMVLYSHQYDLLRKSAPTFFDHRFSPGFLGVAIFFSISGYLITQSWEHDPNIFRFALKRFLRIWPGLFVVTMLAAFVLGPIVSTFNVRTYFDDPLVVKYLRNLHMHMVFTLPGVFETNPYPKAVNGSTWTLPLEICCYACLAISGLLNFLRHPKIIFTSVIIIAIYQFWYYGAETNTVRNLRMEYGLSFCVGMLMWLYRNIWESRRSIVTAATMVAGILIYCLGQRLLSSLVIVGPLVVMFGTTSTPILRRFGRFGDFSYGVYIYAFVVQQVIIMYIGSNVPLELHLGMTVIISFICAFLSWYFVEKPALGLKKMIIDKIGQSLTFPLK
jgi:peptidoglycan/LPS O-acetylase OafA/YrhL